MKKTKSIIEDYDPSIKIIVVGNGMVMRLTYLLFRWVKQPLRFDLLRTCLLMNTRRL